MASATIDLQAGLRGERSSAAFSLILASMAGRGFQPAQLTRRNFRQLFQFLHGSIPLSFRSSSSFFRPRDRRLEMVPSGQIRILAISPMP